MSSGGKILTICEQLSYSILYQLINESEIMDKSVIECFDLGKRFGETWGVKEASFKVARGTVVVLAGPNGAGKTTTIRILTTVYKPDKGFARVAGYDVVKEYREVRKRVVEQFLIIGLLRSL